MLTATTVRKLQWRATRTTLENTVVTTLFISFWYFGIWVALIWGLDVGLFRNNSQDDASEAGSLMASSGSLVIFTAIVSGVLVHNLLKTHVAFGGTRRQFLHAYSLAAVINAALMTLIYLALIFIEYGLVAVTNGVHWQDSERLYVTGISDWPALAGIAFVSIAMSWLLGATIGLAFHRLGFFGGLAVTLVTVLLALFAVGYSRLGLVDGNIVNAFTSHNTSYLLALAVNLAVGLLFTWWLFLAGRRLQIGTE